MDYVTLEKLAADIGVHPRTLRRYMDDPTNPLPTHHVCVGGKDRGRVLVSRKEFDAWVSRFPAGRSHIKPQPAKVTALDRRVAAAVRSIRGG